MTKTLSKFRRRGAGRPLAADAQAHREAILQVATEVFLENGFLGSSISRIAERAGASKGTLYALYPSKVELFAALVQRRIAAHITSEDWDQLSCMGKPVEQTLETFGFKLLRWVGSEEARRWQQLVTLESERFPELSRLLWKNGPAIGLDNLTRYFKAASLAGLLEVFHPEQAAQQFLGLTIGIHYIRNSLGMPPILGSETETRAWVHHAVKTFLEGYKVLAGHPKKRT